MTTLTELQQLARNATPGPWTYLPCVKRDGTPTWRYGGETAPFESGYSLNEPDVRYIAACSPERILALIEALEKAKEALRYIASHEESIYASHTPANVVATFTLAALNKESDDEIT